MCGVVDVPGRYARQAARSPGNGAVTLAGGNEFEALEVGAEGNVAGAQLIVDDRGRLAAGDIDHVLRIGRGRLEEAPGGGGFLQVFAFGSIPAGADFLAQRRPPRLVGEIRIVRGEGQQFEQAGVAGNEADDVIGAVRDVEQRQLALGRVETGQPAYGFVGAENWACRASGNGCPAGG